MGTHMLYKRGDSNDYPNSMEQKYNNYFNRLLNSNKLDCTLDDSVFFFCFFFEGGGGWRGFISVTLT